MATKTMEKSLAEILAMGGGKYLSDKEKSRWSDEERPFDIVKVEKTTGTYEKKKRERWELTVISDGVDRFLTIPTHEDRDEKMVALQAYVKSHKKAGPCVLVKREMQNGHTWLSIEAAPEKKGR